MRGSMFFSLEIQASASASVLKSVSPPRHSAVFSHRSGAQPQECRTRRAGSSMPLEGRRPAPPTLQVRKGCLSSSLASYTSCKHVNLLTYTHTNTHKYTYIGAHPQTQTCIRHTVIHRQVHMHTHAHPQIHIHTGR
jgi:hypothetical protein